MNMMMRPMNPPPPKPWVPPLPPMTSGFWNATNVQSSLKELQNTIDLAEAMEKELEMLMAMKYDKNNIEETEYCLYLLFFCYRCGLICESLFHFLQLRKCFGVELWKSFCGSSVGPQVPSNGLADREEGDLGPVYGFQWRHFGASYTNMHAYDMLDPNPEINKTRAFSSGRR